MSALGPGPAGAGARAGSIPPSARRSAEHTRALRAASTLGLALTKKLAQRPLLSLWEGAAADGARALVAVVDACATDAESARILGAARALQAVRAPRVQALREVCDDPGAFVGELLASGTSVDVLLLRWPLRERVQFVTRVCEGLEALHAAGIVHGCASPENVVLDDDLGPVLTEAGMVSIAESLEGDREGFFGYGAYAAPEAQTGGRLDARSDVFSAGRLLAFLVLEREPDERAGDELALKSAALAAVYRKATAPAPEQRHASVTELRGELDALKRELATAGSHATRAPAPSRAAARPSEPGAGGRPSKPGDARELERGAPGRLSRPGDAGEPEGDRAQPPQVGIALGGLVALVVLVVVMVLVPLPDVVAFALTASFAIAAAAATLAIPTPALKWRAALVATAIAGAVAAQPVAVCGAIAARVHMRSAAPLGRDSVRRLLASGDRSFSGANLAGADLTRLDLAYAQLDGANLAGADLSSSNLTGAALERAVLAGASLGGADLSGSTLGAAQGVETAKCTRATMLPAGWRCAGSSPQQAPSEP